MDPLTILTQEFPFPVEVNGEVVAQFKHLDLAEAYAEEHGGDVAYPTASGLLRCPNTRCDAVGSFPTGEDGRHECPACGATWD